MRTRQDVQRKQYFCGATLACVDNNDLKYCIYDTLKSNLYILYISIAYIFLKNTKMKLINMYIETIIIKIIY